MPPISGNNYRALREKYGHDKADRITRHYIRNYTRLALITSENHGSEAYHKYARMVADRFDLSYEEIPGSNDFLERLIHGDWNTGFVLVPPGQVVTHGMVHGGGPPSRG